MCFFSLSPLFYDGRDVSQKYITGERTCNTLLCISIDFSIISSHTLVQGKRGRLFVTSPFQKGKIEVWVFFPSKMVTKERVSMFLLHSQFVKLIIVAPKQTINAGVV